MRNWINLFEAEVIKLRGFSARKNAPSDEFLADIDTLGFRNPLNPRQIVLDGVKIEISRDLDEPENAVHLSDMASHEPGAGSKALDQLSYLADKHAVTIKLIAKGYAHTPTEVLVVWYICNGFHPEHQYIDFDDGVDMIRNPFASKFTLPKEVCEQSPENDEACRRGMRNADNSGGAFAELADAFRGYSLRKLHATVPRLYAAFVAFS